MQQTKIDDLERKREHAFIRLGYLTLAQNIVFNKFYPLGVWEIPEPEIDRAIDLIERAIESNRREGVPAA